MQPTINSFSVDTPVQFVAYIASNSSTYTISWNVSNATSVTVTDFQGNIVGNGSSGSYARTLTSNDTTNLNTSFSGSGVSKDASGNLIAVYTLTATNDSGTTTAQVPVYIVLNSNSYIAYFPSTTPISSGTSVKISWGVTSLVSTLIQGSLNITSSGNTVASSLALNGSISVTPAVGTQSYVLNGTISGVSQGFATTPLLRVNPPTVPTINSFTVTNANLPAGGGNVTLTWSTTGATSASIDQNVGSVATSGNVSLTVAVSTTYTLTATNSVGSSTAQLTIHVAPPAVQLASGSYQVDQVTGQYIFSSLDKGAGVNITYQYKGTKVGSTPTVADTYQVDSSGNYIFYPSNAGNDVYTSYTCDGAFVNPGSNMAGNEGNQEVMVPTSLTQGGNQVAQVTREYTLLTKSGTSDLGSMAVKTRPYIVGENIGLNPLKPWFNSPTFAKDPAYTVRVRSGQVLPPGLSLDTTTGLVYGKLGGTGVSTTVLEYIRAGVVVGVVSVNWDLVSSSFTLSDGIVDGNLQSPYTGSIVSPVNLTNASVLYRGRLPLGLTASVSGNTIVISGTPTEAGYFDVWFVATSTSGSKAYLYKRIAVRYYQPLQVLDTALPAMVPNQAYSYQMHAVGGTLPYSWDIVSSGGGTQTQTARYWLIKNVLPQYWASWREIEFYAGSTKLSPTVVGGSTDWIYPSQGAYGKAAAIDGNTNNQWNSAAPGWVDPWIYPTYIVLDLGSAVAVTKIRMCAAGTGMRDVIIYGDNSSTPTTKVYEYTGSINDGAWIDIPITMPTSDGTTSSGPLTISSSGLLTGTTTASSGSYSLNLRVTDAKGVKATASLSVSVSSTVAVTTSVIPVATIGQPFLFSISASGGQSPYTNFTQTNSGTSPLPAGLDFLGAPYHTFNARGTYNPSTSYSQYDSATYNGSTWIARSTTQGVTPGTDSSHWLPVGTLVGTPTGSAYDKYLAFTVTDSSSTTSTSASLELKAVLGTTTTLTINSYGIRSVPLGSSYLGTLTVSGGSGPYNWYVASDSPHQLPSGLVFTSNNYSATISGTTTTNFSNLSVKITVVDANGNQANTVISLSSTSALQITSLNPPLAKVGSPYSYTLTSTGGVGAVTWSSGALPTGYALSNGVISGTYSGASTSVTVAVTATDSLGSSQTVNLTLTISGSSLAITTTTLGQVTAGKSYSATLTATGGTGSYHWALDISSAPLPSGLTLSPTGTLAGTTTKIGVFPSVVFKVTDSTGATTTAVLSLTVAATVSLVSWVDSVNNTSTGLLGYVSNGDVTTISPRPNHTFFVLATGVVSTLISQLTASVNVSGISATVVQLDTNAAVAYIQLAGSFGNYSAGTQQLTLTVYDSGVAVTRQFSWVVYSHGNLTLGVSSPIALYEGTPASVALYNSGSTFVFPNINGTTPTAAQIAPLVSLAGNNGFWSGVVKAANSGSNLVLSYDGSALDPNKGATQLSVTVPDVAWVSSLGLDTYTPNSLGGGISTTVEVDYFYRATIASVSPQTVTANTVATFTVMLNKPLPPAQAGANLTVTFNNSVISSPSSITPIIVNGWLSGWTVTTSISNSNSLTTVTMSATITGNISYLNGSSVTSGAVTYSSANVASITVNPAAVTARTVYIANFNLSDPWNFNWLETGTTVTQNPGRIPGTSALKFTCPSSAYQAESILQYASPVNLLTGSGKPGSDIFTFSIKSVWPGSSVPDGFGVTFTDSGNKTAAWGYNYAYYPTPQSPGDWLTLTVARQVQTYGGNASVDGSIMYGDPSFDWTNVVSVMFVLGVPGGSGTNYMWICDGYFTPSAG